MPSRSVSVIISAVFFSLFGLIALGFGFYLLFLSSGLGMGWVNRFPPFSYSLVIVGMGFLVTSYFLLKSRRVGAYIGVISFGIAFVTNLIVAGNFFVHLWAGSLLGILLLAPLFFGRKSLT